MRIKQAISKWLRGHGKVTSWVASGVIVGAAGSAVVLASIPDSSGVIHACYSTGLLAKVRIIDSPSQTCNAGETAITWNQTGPQGPTGPTGPQGPAGNSGPGSFLSNLVGADFTSASLQYRDFANADVHNAIFAGANLTGSDFSGANLSGIATSAGSGSSALYVTFKKVNFEGANFTGATVDIRRGLSSTSFKNANFTNATLKASNNDSGGDFRGVTLNGATISANFSGSNWSGVDFRSIGLWDNGGFLNSSNVTNTNWSGMTISTMGVAYGADVSNANFSNTVLTNIYWDNGAVVNGTNLTNAQISDSSFSGTDLSNATLTGVTWSNVYCPDDTNSDANGGTCIGHLVP